MNSTNGSKKWNKGKRISLRQTTAGIVKHVCKFKYIYIYIYMVGCQNVGSWIGQCYLIYIGARFISILWAYHTFILAKSRIQYFWCGRRTSADLFASFAAISAATALTTTDLLSLVSLASWWLEIPMAWLALGAWSCASGGWLWSLHVGHVGRWLSKGSRFKFC